MARYTDIAIWRPLTGSKGTNWREGRARRIPGQPLVFVGHNAVSQEDSLFNLFNNPARRASCHFFINKQGGIEQYVDTKDTAFTNGCNRPQYLTPLAQKLCGSGNNSNDNCITCELEGGTYNPAYGYAEPMTQPQFFSAVKLMRKVREVENGGAPLQLGINVGEHNWFATTACPSNRWSWNLLIPAANRGAPTPAPTGPPTFAEVRAVLQLDTDAKFGAYTLSKRDNLRRLLKKTFLEGDPAWAWAITTQFNTDVGKPYDTSWDG